MEERLSAAQKKHNMTYLSLLREVAVRCEELVIFVREKSYGGDPATWPRPCGQLLSSIPVLSPFGTCFTSHPNSTQRSVVSQCGQLTLHCNFPQYFLIWSDGEDDDRTLHLQYHSETTVLAAGRGAPLRSFLLPRAVSQVRIPGSLAEVLLLQEGAPRQLSLH